jgi:flagellin-like protein
MKTLRTQRREGITPVIATVILIAVTLIAAVAVTGFTFGLFGSFTSSPLVTVIGSSLSAGTLTGAAGTSLTASCATSAGAGSYVQLGNTGTASIAVTGGTIVYGTSTIPLSLTTSCSGASPVTVAPGASFYLQLTVATKMPTAAAGQQFILNVVLANGVTIPASGTFVA